MRKEELAKEYILLNRLGLTANYTGFFQTAYAVALCAEEPERLRLVTKWVYPEVARRFKTTQAAVERNVRTAGTVIWKGNRRLLEELAQHPLTTKPCNAQLLAILSCSQTVYGQKEAAPEGCPAPLNRITSNSDR